VRLDIAVSLSNISSSRSDCILFSFAVALEISFVKFVDIVDSAFVALVISLERFEDMGVVIAKTQDSVANPLAEIPATTLASALALVKYRFVPSGKSDVELFVSVIPPVVSR